MNKKLFMILVILFLPSFIIAKETEIMIYQCDYAEDSYYTVLSSGHDQGANFEVSEVWGINKEDYISLPNIKFIDVKINKIIEKAKRNLDHRFPEMKLILTEIDYRRINTDDLENPRNWYILLHFKEDIEKESFMMIPVLLDGRIILSKNE